MTFLMRLPTGNQKGGNGVSDLDICLTADRGILFSMCGIALYHGVSNSFGSGGQIHSMGLLTGQAPCE